MQNLDPNPLLPHQIRHPQDHLKADPRTAVARAVELRMVVEQTRTGQSDMIVSLDYVVE